KIYDANFVDFLAFVLPHLLAVFMVSDFLFGRVRWSFVSELYELIQSVYTLPAIVKVFFNPRAPRFNVTIKGERLDQDFISPLARPFYFFLGLNTVAFVFGIYKLVVYPADHFPTGITMAWALFNIIILLAAMGVLLERRQRRATPRMPGRTPVKVLVGGKVYAGVTEDLSIGGASVIIDAAYQSVFTNGRSVHLAVDNPAWINKDPFHVVVCNVRDNGSLIHVGFKFQHTTIEEMRRKIAWVNGSSERWMEFQTGRERRLGVIRSALFLVRCGIKYSLQHFGQIMLQGSSRQKVAAFGSTPAPSS
ncbi:MAG: PilZ domain-containing protein, partial [Terrimicrobiaceae bacterium]|nr:PilZ domain-containing protein [Terrimicrobiaceae bacterium]